MLEVSKPPESEGLALVLPESGDNPRLCAYERCWREVVTDAPTPVIGMVEPETGRLICLVHVQQLDADLRWLEANLPDLTGYRLNRAYGGGHGAGGAKTAPAPLREQLADLLWSDDDNGNPGLEGLLTEWCRCLALNLTPSERNLPDSCRRLRECYRLTTNPAVAVYGPALHALTRKLRRFLDPSAGEEISYGRCDCGGTLTGLPGDLNARCASCRNGFPVVLLKARQVRRLLASERVGTRGELMALMNECGVKVNRSTMRSWISREQLRQCGENDRSEPVYRFADLYRLATGFDADMDEWSLIQQLTERTGE